MQQPAFTSSIGVRPSTVNSLTRPLTCAAIRTTTLLPTTTPLRTASSLPTIVESNDTTTTSRNATTMKIFDWKKRTDPNYGVLPAEDEGIFKLNNLRPAPGSRKRKKRKGRGDAAGGARCGFGMRGQKSRSGRSVRPGFEGGQTPLYRRIPKFVGRPMGPGHKKTEYALIKLEYLNSCAEGEIVTFESLYEKGVMTKQKRRSIFKVVGGRRRYYGQAEEEEKEEDNNGMVVTVQNLTVKAHAFTSAAVEAIENANGTCVLLSPTTGKDIIFDDDGNVVDENDNDDEEEEESGTDSEDESESESESES